jgi:uncharacterized protein involved in tolerance to divalent cations
MIFLRISSYNEAVIEQIAELLLKERLVIDVNIKRNIERLVLSDGALRSITTTLMTSKTKGLLFSQIDERIRAQFPNETMELYSLPIIHMDWEDAKHLKEDIQEV